MTPHIIVKKLTCELAIKVSWSHNPEACRVFPYIDQREVSREPFRWLVESANYMRVPLPNEILSQLHPNELAEYWVKAVLGWENCAGTKGHHYTPISNPSDQVKTP